MFIVGLTGGIGSGKSTVSKMLIDLGVPIIDADRCAREVVEPGRKAWKRIHETFGTSVFLDDGQINRKKLAEIIFNDSSQRAKLNAITHPEIAKEMLLQLVNNLIRGHQFVVIDSPLLFEVNTWRKLMYRVIVVSCDENQQLQRLMARDKCSKEEAVSRINAQMSMEEKRKKADYVVHNKHSIQETRLQVDKIYNELKSSKLHVTVRVVLGTVVASLTYAVYAIRG